MHENYGTLAVARCDPKLSDFDEDLSTEKNPQSRQMFQQWGEIRLEFPAFQVPSACNCISAQTVISTVPSSLRTTGAEVIFSSSTAEEIVP